MSFFGAVKLAGTNALAAAHQLNLNPRGFALPCQRAENLP